MEITNKLYFVTQKVDMIDFLAFLSILKNIINYSQNCRVQYNTSKDIGIAYKIFPNYKVNIKNFLNTLRYLLDINLLQNPGYYGISLSNSLVQKKTKKRLSLLKILHIIFSYLCLLSMRVFESIPQTICIK